MKEHRCPACGRPTASPGTLCSACSTSGYSQDPGNRFSPSSPSLEDSELLDMMPSSKLDTDDLPTEVESQSPTKRKTKKTKKYALPQVVTAAGRAVAAVGADNLPLEAQRKALELAKRWLQELKE